MVTNIIYIIICVLVVFALLRFCIKIEDKVDLNDEPWIDTDPIEFESKIEKELNNGR